MKISGLLLELVDVNGYKRRARLKRALREREIRVLGDVRAWEHFSLSQKETLQEKCRRLSEHYFMLARTLGDEERGFSDALKCLDVWHETVCKRKGSDALIQALARFIEGFKATKHNKSDQIALFKLAILYHQLAVIRLGGSVHHVVRHGLTLKPLCEHLLPQLDFKALTFWLLKERKKRGESFFIEFLSILIKEEQSIKENILKGFFSQSFSLHINVLHFIAHSPENVYGGSEKLEILIRLKKKSSVLYAFYVKLIESLSVFQSKRTLKSTSIDIIHADGVLPFSIEIPSSLRQDLKNVLLDDIVPMPSDNAFQRLFWSLHQSYGTHFNIIRWFDVLFAMQKEKNFQQEMLFYLNDLPLRTLLNAYQYFMDKTFNEMLYLIKQKANQHAFYHQLFEQADILIRCYEKVIDQNGCRCASLPFLTPDFEKRIHNTYDAFFERLERLYLCPVIANEKTLNRLFSEVMREDD